MAGSKSGYAKLDTSPDEGSPVKQRMGLQDGRPAARTIAGLPVSVFAGAAYCCSSMGMVSPDRIITPPPAQLFSPLTPATPPPLR